MLEYEILGGLIVSQVKAGVAVSNIELQTPWHPELPADWWTSECDKSLLIGIYKHGFEMFTLMRDDPLLCFLKKCGAADIPAPADDGENKEEETGETGIEITVKSSQPTEPNEGLPFPSLAELNARVRRLMSLYQRTSRLTTMREEANKKAIMHEKELKRMSEKQKWSRREETDFYRTLTSFGIEQDTATGEYIWDRFKQLGRLESKYDQTMTDYYMAFSAMCKRVCKKPLSKVEGRTCGVAVWVSHLLFTESLSLIPEPVSEERANKVLSRVEFMARVRAAVKHSKFMERIKLCKRTPELPAWWECGSIHDIHLIKAVVV
jgi:hypothetical protein